MAAALSEFENRLDEILAAAKFVNRAFRLRPRIGSSIIWGGMENDLRTLVLGFLAQNMPVELEVMNSLLVRSVGCFERYIRAVAAEALSVQAALASTPGDLPDELRKRNLVLSARLLASLDSPKDHVVFDTRAVITNLARCENNQKPYQLNAVAFSSFIQSPSSDAVDKVLSSVGVNQIFESVGRYLPMQEMLNLNDTRTTNKRTVARLTEIIRWRNNLAHAGDDERSIDSDDLGHAIDFLRTLGRGIDEAVGSEFPTRPA